MPYGADPTEPPHGYGKDPTAKPAVASTSPSAGADQGGTWAGALWRGLTQGAMDVVHGGAQIGARMGPEIGDTTTTPEQSQGLTQRVDQAAQQSAQAYQNDPHRQAHPIAAGIGRIGGNVAATAPLMALPGGAASIPGRIGMGAAAGAMGAAAQPVTGGDYWTEKAKQVGIGAAAGGALGGAGRAIGPPLGQAAQDAISKFPHIAALIRGTAARSPDNFNRGAINQALDPIGAVIPPNVKAGHELINAGSDALTDAYNKVLPRLSLRADPDFMLKGMADIRSAGEELLPDQQKVFLKLVENRIEKPLADARGMLDGEAIKRAESALTKKASAYGGSSDAGQRELSEALYAARESMMEAVARQNPEAAGALQRVNQAYAMFTRVRAAASRKADSEGVFTPQDLLAASRSGDKSAGKGSFAKGDAAMQAVGEATKGPMSAGKVNRQLLSILGTIGGAATEGGALGAGAGGAIGYAAPEILKGAARATQHPISRGVGAGVSSLAPAAGEEAGRRITKPGHKTEPPP